MCMAGMRGKIAYFGRYGCVSVGWWVGVEGECVKWSGDAGVLPVTASVTGKMERLGVEIWVGEFTVKSSR